jgi:hypothetical protein
MAMSATTKPPTVVLAHGAWADGSSWTKVIAALHQTGTTVTAAPIPLTTLADDIAALAPDENETVADDGQSGAPTRIELDTTNGRTLSTACDVNNPRRSDRAAPTRLGQLPELAAAALSPDEVEAVIAAVDALPTAAKLADLITSCTPNG